MSGDTLVSYCCDVAADGGVCTCIDLKYVKWIRRYQSAHPHLLGMCVSGANAMKEAFPELTIVRGHVQCPHPYGKRGHVWLVDQLERIVDPTAEQFPAIYAYQAWKPGDEVRVGKCRNCGMDIWKAVDTLDKDHTTSVCSSECEEELMKELNW